MAKFKDFLIENRIRRYDSDLHLREGIFRRMKTAVGHSLPNRVRNGIMVPVMIGKIMGAETEKDRERFREFRKKLIQSKHKLPKFADS